MQNHYETLGVKQDADDTGIKKAYNKLVLKFHPDKNTDPEANAQFLIIQNAYETLIDKEKRQAYDANIGTLTTGDAVNITAKEFILLESKANATGLTLAYLAECYKNPSDKRYIKISDLLVYLKNHKKRKEPALSLQEVLATEDQERINLQSGYKLIKDKFMTIENVCGLSEKERMIIVNAGQGKNEEAMRNLAKYREDNPFVSDSQNRSLPQSGIGQVSSTVFHHETVLVKQVIIEPPPFITAIVENTGLSLNHIMDCYYRRNNDNDYSNIAMLELYLQNHKNETEPALSLLEVLKTSPKEAENLFISYLIIKEQLMTIDQAKSLSEEERMILALASINTHEECEAAIEQLNEFRVRSGHSRR